MQKLTQQAQLIEAGSTVTLADATALVANDVRFPTQAFVAVEKLYGWSVVIDVFHGVNHPVVVNLRRAVLELGPSLQCLAASTGDSAPGMDLICRVLFDMQQDYFMYLSAQAGKQPGDVPAVAPTFQGVIDAVSSSRAERLSPLPITWHSIRSCPKGRGPAAAAAPPNSPAAMVPPPIASVTVVNPHADRRLLKCFKDSGHATITAMVGGRDGEFPKHGGKSVCMSWALRGSCTTTCKRASQHSRYNPVTQKALHDFLDFCEVAGTQS